MREWIKGKPGVSVELPAWFWSMTPGQGWGVTSAETIEQVPGNWTHWMEKADKNMPLTSPNDRIVSRQASEAAEKILIALPGERKEQMIQDAIDASLEDVRATIRQEIIPVLERIGKYQCRNSINGLLVKLKAI